MADDVKIKYAGTRVEALEKLAADPRKVLVEVGTHLVKVTGRSFREQQRGPNRWEPRRVPNIPGALRDLDVSANVKSRRFQGRPALIDTNQLAKSFAYRFVGNRRIVFGTKVPYANLHQHGGESRIRVTGTMRENLAKWLKKRRGAEKREAKKAESEGRKPPDPVSTLFGWIFQVPRGGEVTFRVKARPFVGFFRDDYKVLQAAIQRHARK